MDVARIHAAVVSLGWPQRDAPVSDRRDAIGATFGGFPHALHRYDDAAVAESPGFCDRGTEFSHWLNRADLLASLRYFGFTEIDIGFDHPHHPNGPSLAFAAVRR